MTGSNRLVVPVLKLFIPLYLGLAVLHWFMLSDQIRLVMTSLSIATALVGVAVCFAKEQVLASDSISNAILGVLVLFGAVNAFTHLCMSGEAHQATNLLFVLAVAGFLVTDRVTFFSFGAAVLLAWMTMVVTYQWAESGHYTVMLGIGACLALLLRKARQALEKSQTRHQGNQKVLDSLLSSMPAGVLARDSDGVITYANEAVSALTRLPQETLIGMAPDDPRWRIVDECGALIPVEKLPMMEALRTGEPLQNVFCGFDHGDGDITWLFCNFFSYEQHGEKHSIASFIDITERTRFQKAIEGREQFTRQVLNAVDNAVLSADDRDFVTGLNPGAAELFGYELEDALNRPLAEILDFRRSQVPQLIGNGHIRRRDGRYVAVDLRVTEMQDPLTQAPIGKVITARDVEQQIKQERELRVLDKMNSIGVLAGGIAHDFNNLLLGLYGNLTLALQKAADPELVMHLESASASLSRATDLTRQLLTFSTGSEPVRTVVRIDQLMESAVNLALSGSSCAVSVNTDPHLRATNADVGQLHQAFSNLLINAKQATANHGEITVELKNADDDQIVITIADNGVGIQPEDQEKIFEPFFSTKEAGSGLGLASTHSIVRKHSGTISVDSAPGVGTTFTIVLPAILGSCDTPVDTDESQDQKGGGRRILVMDDDVAVRHTVEQLLSALGHEVEAVGDGEAVLECYRSALRDGSRPDCVIMDLTVVGGMGGQEAAREIRSIDPEACLIVSSGYSRESEMANFEEYGFTGVLQKPYTLAQLEQTLDGLFQAQVEPAQAASF